MATTPEGTSTSPSTTPILDECAICSNTYTQRLRTRVKCPFCNFECCRQCSKHYILTKTQPQCIQCHAIWNEEFMESAFSPSWVDGELRTHLDTSLFEQEKSMLAAASQELYRRELQEKRDELQRQFNATNNLVDETRYHIRNAENLLDQARRRLHYTPERQRPYIERDVNQKERTVYDLRNQLRIREEMLEKLLRDIEDFNEANDEKLEITSVSIRCPKSNCNGFLTSKFYCPVCHGHYCRECHVRLRDPKGEEHKCDPDLVRTLKLIVKDTKPCPNCKMPIFKLEGCNMMFCTNCNTGFNWATGEIERGRIHNPHYFEWLRRNGGENGAHPTPAHQEAGQGECRIQTREIHEICQSESVPHEIRDRLYSGLRLIIHIEEVMIGPPLPDIANRHLNLRMQYISSKGAMSESDWKKTLSQEHREFRIRFKFRQLIDTLRMVILDLYRRFKVDRKWATFTDELYAIIDYFNEHSMKLSLRYGRRFYTGIRKKTLDEYNFPIVDKEAPFDFATDLNKYLSPPGEHHHYNTIPEWLDEDELIYFNTFLYFYKLWYVPSPATTDYYTVDFLERLTQHTPSNLAIHRYEDLVSSRICSHPKKRIDVLDKIGSMIHTIVQRIINGLLSHGMSLLMGTPAVQIKTHQGIMTCSWLVPIFSNPLFPIEICGYSVDFTPFFNYRAEINGLGLRNVLGTEDPIVPTEAIRRDGEENHDYRSYRSVSAIFCSYIGHHISEYQTLLTNAQLWKIFYNRVKNLFDLFNSTCCNRQEDWNAFLPAINRLYIALLRDKTYTRPKLIKREYERMIRLLVYSSQQQNQILEATQALLDTTS